ncbi:hypothetical protein ATY79_08675 [Rhizobium sp. R693]|nr:hypothetical protein ATY79_08675 [Rhizobium sp. R693]
MCSGILQAGSIRCEPKAKTFEIERKWALDAAGVSPTEDKLYCLWKWQLGEIEAAKASAAA